MNRHVTIARNAEQLSEVPDQPMRLEPEPGFVIEERWRGRASGPEVQRTPAHIEFAPEPGPGGAAFRTVTFPPGSEPHIHRTETTDLIVVVDGEPTLVLAAGDEARLGCGDTVVLCGAEHGWTNETDRPATIAVVLLSARSN